MPLAVLFPALFQMTGPLAFLTAVGVSGALNRSLLIVPLLALAATLTSIFLRWVIPPLRTEIQNILEPGRPHSAPPPYAGAVRGFILRCIGYGLLFLFVAMIAALFQVTEFEPRLMPTDSWIILVPVCLAIPSRLLAHHFGFSRARNFAADLHAAFRHEADSADDSAFTIDGEIITPKSDPD